MLREVAISILTLVCPLGAGTKGELKQIDRLLSCGKCEQALKEVGLLRGALAPSERLTAWELDFRGEVLRVAHGMECFYYLLHRSNSHEDAPGRAGALDCVSANRHRSDREYVVVCVALETGDIRWSRAVNGQVYLGVDPENDILYLYRERVVALAPDSGKILEQQDLPTEGAKVGGLLIGSDLILARPHGSRVSSDARLLVYDVRQNVGKEVRVGDYRLLAPDESRRLVPTNSGWECLSVPEGRKEWSLQAVFQRGNLPLWHGNHPTFITGTERQFSVVTSIDISTGKSRWSTALGWGAYSTSQHQLRGGGYQDDWTALVALNEYLLALDGSGRLYLLDPADGRAAATPRLCRDLVAMPFQHGNQLIVPSFEWVRSYSIAALIRPSASLDACLQVREARCLLALGRVKAAIELLDVLVERAPQFVDGWSERAVACKAVNDIEEEVFSRCEALSLSGELSDAILGEDCGLLRLYNLEGKPAWGLKVVGGHVYAGTLAGALWISRTGSLDFRAAARLDHEITSFDTVTKLQGVLGNSTHTRRAIPQTSVMNDSGIPREWNTEGGAAKNQPSGFLPGSAVPVSARRWSSRTFRH